MKNQKNRIKKIHFVGIKGVGIAPLAIIAKEAGFDVAGSDIEEAFITDQEINDAGIQIFSGFDSKNIEGVDLVITTGAHGGFSNPESKSARERGITVISQAEALSKFMDGSFFGKDFFGIAVSGSHGKTTTAAIISTVLKENSLDPSYSIGTGNIPSLGKSGHFGRGKYFVGEEDEYVVDVDSDTRPKLLLLRPKVIIVTNVDYDHPDVYPSISELSAVFLEFANKLGEDGLLIACGDSIYDKKLLKDFGGRKISFGMSRTNDFYIEKVSMNEDQMFFWVRSNETLLGEFSMRVFGEHNAVNALSAIALGLEIGLSLDQIKKGLAVYKGSKRRSEYIGKTSGSALVYDDYAHHPQEIKRTLEAFKTSFPKKKIVAIFQPHMHSRTKKLLEQFISSFESADEVIITEIFSSFREKRDPKFSAKQIAEPIRNKAVFISSLSDVIKYADEKNYSSDTVIITMGAGDVYKIGSEITV